jgi:two-component system, OmpR family, alkaline phosphatase synthesis response regulator PhoP
MSGRLILLADDEPSMTELLEFNLKKEGFEVVSAGNGKEAMEKFRRRPVSLVILDIMMPEMDGYDVCREIRKTSDVPIIMLTAKGSESSKIVGLELGADDYVTKPFSVAELTARVKAVLRRSAREGAPSVSDRKEILAIGNLIIDKPRREVTVGGERIDLTSKEFDLLYFLASNPGIVFTRDRILDLLWGDDVCVVDRTIDVHVRHLRQKLETAGGPSGCVTTIRGVGYKFEARRGTD